MILRNSKGFNQMITLAEQTNFNNFADNARLPNKLLVLSIVDEFMFNELSNHLK